LFVQKQDLTMVDPLTLKDGQGKNAERILKVIMAHVTSYWKIKSIHSDGEGGKSGVEDSFAISVGVLRTTGE
jgi:hypothetical protein